MEKILCLLLVSGLLGACAGHQELRAPCSPLDCSGRIPVNSWPAERA